jgi:hypothetical protein
MINEIPWENFSFEDPDDIIAYGDERVQAERSRILGLLEDAQTMHNIWWVLYRKLEPSPKSGRLYQTEIADLLRAELMGEDDGN